MEEKVVVTKTQKRIDEIESTLKSHKSSIRLLNKYAKLRAPSKKHNSAPRIVKFNSLPKSEACFRWTIKNLTDQTLKLEIELAILKQYGV